MDALEAEQHYIPPAPHMIPRKPPPSDSSVEEEKESNSDKNHPRESARLSDGSVGLAT